MSEQNHISSISNWALRWEIGERLRADLAVNDSPFPPAIEKRLDKLRELEGLRRPSWFDRWRARWLD
jgi:hypothetical protein